MAVIPTLSQCYDEPFADASQIPTVLITKLARQAVTVSLTGDGSDELFGGYNRHVWGPKLWRVAGRLPWLLRTGAAGAVHQLSPHQWDRVFGLGSRWIHPSFKQSRAGEKLYKMAELLAARSMHAAYASWTSCWHQPPTLGDHHESLFAINRATFSDDLHTMMFADLTGYLPDDLLVKVDRASMAASLEVRVPFLDPSVVAFAWGLPASFKVKDGRGKWLLRLLLDRYIPRALMDRPKMGFGVPLDQWLRGPLKEWASELMEPKQLRDQGMLDAALVSRRWKEHLSGNRNCQYQLWSVLMFQAWLGEFSSIPTVTG